MPSCKHRDVCERLRVLATKLYESIQHTPQKKQCRISWHLQITPELADKVHFGFLFTGRLQKPTWAKVKCLNPWTKNIWLWNDLTKHALCVCILMGLVLVVAAPSCCVPALLWTTTYMPSLFCCSFIFRNRSKTKGLVYVLFWSTCQQPAYCADPTRVHNYVHTDMKLG